MALLGRNWLTGYENPLVRLYRIRVRHAVIICLPFWFVLLWYTVLPLSEHYSYNHAYGYDQPLTWEIFHLRLSDQLHRDWRRFTLPQVSRKARIPTFELFLSNSQLASLDRDAPPKEGKGKYAVGVVRRNNRDLKARLRYRGLKHWNWNYAQKSWKVRLDDELVRGQQTFSFINPVNPVPFAEQIILDIARNNGLLTPDFFPIRLMLNKAYMGVYWFMGQPDEFLLRRNDRFPGSIYSGNRAESVEKNGDSSLFYRAKYWKKPSSRLAEAKPDKSDLQQLLDMIWKADAARFASFAHEHLDLSKFALMDALDVVFGGTQHDWDQDHKLYFDPYRGRWEPLAWDFRGYRHRTTLNLGENPLQLRLKELPEYLTLRNRWVLKLIQLDASPYRVAVRARELETLLSAELASDPYWDAYSLLPEVSRYFRQWVRPMNHELLNLALESMLAVFRKRAGFLQDRLQAPAVDARLLRGSDAWDRLSVVVDGASSLRLKHVRMTFAGTCETSPSLLADANEDGRAQPGETSWEGTEVTPGLSLSPGLVLEPLPSPSAARGRVSMATQARRYDFLVLHGGGCRLARLSVELVHELTDRTQVLELAPQDATAPMLADLARIPGPTACTPLAGVAEPGRRSVHPWCLPTDPTGPVVFGPGEVRVDTERVFWPGQPVTIRPGTRFLLAPGASMIFFDRLTAVGTAAQPIRFERVGDAAWGGLTLQGPGTRGSTFSHVTITGGSKPADRLTELPGMINVHDTAEIEFSDCLIGHNTGSDNVLHAAYVEHLKIVRLRAEHCPADALDLEFVQGEVLDSTIFRTGDECIDLMGTRLRVDRVQLLGCGGNAVSAGERSDVRISAAIIVGGDTGLLAKNNSDITCSSSIIYRTVTGVRVEKKQERYAGASRIIGDELYVLRSGIGYVGPQSRFNWSGAGPSFETPEPARLTGLFPGLTTGEQLLEKLEALFVKVQP
ncbi:CotH kinase family protein [Myxococcota bacterium]|nr:CotH kinase family protein [Myxococcota bacterium]